MLAIEDPPNCSLANGGQGNTSVGGLNFALSQAHVGDTVSVFPNLGMVVGACKSVNTTGAIYIATGHLTNFMENVTLDPDGVHTCPSDPLCQPGPYSFLITAPMVGAGVDSPNVSVPGVAKTVRAVENGIGTVKNTLDEQLTDAHVGSISIVTPCIQVFEICGRSCIGDVVNFTGYVLNCGDITLTNVTAVDARTTLTQLDGSAWTQPFTLTNSQTVQFKGSFTPNGAEITSSMATNTITVMGTDTTAIGGPFASVTNSVTTICSITSCTNCLCVCLP